MGPVQATVQRLLQDMMIAAGNDPSLERETTEIIPLAMANALAYETTSPSQVNLCAQISVVKALRQLGER